jgi:hypothetical protein
VLIWQKRHLNELLSKNIEAVGGKMNKFYWTHKRLTFLADLFENEFKENGFFGWKEGPILKSFIKKYPFAPRPKVKEMIWEFHFNRHSFMAHRFGRPEMCPRVESHYANNVKPKCFWQKPISFKEI